MKNIFQKFMALLLLVVISIVLAQIEMGSGIALAFALPVGFANLTFPCGEENMGGYKNRILFIPACSVSAVPELSTTEATTAADLVTAAGAFTFKTTGDKPIFIYATKGTVQLNAEPQGELDGKSYVQTVEFVHPGSSAEASAFARKVNNTPGYVIVEDKKGVQYMIGQSGMPAYISPSFAGGAAATDRKGFTFTGEADSFSPFIILGTPIDMDEIENPVAP